MPSLDNRVKQLESTFEQQRGPLLLVVRGVIPGRLGEYPSGILPAPPHLPATERTPGEDWDAFLMRLLKSIKATHAVVLTTAR